MQSHKLVNPFSDELLFNIVSQELHVVALSHVLQLYFIKLFISIKVDISKQI
jgi:hypothetical protein